VLPEVLDHPGIDLEGGHRAPALERQVDEPLEQLVPRGGVGTGGLGLVHPRAQLGQLALGHRDHDRLLRTELVVDGGLRDPELVGDHLQRRGADPSGREQLEGHLDRPFLGGGERHGVHGTDCAGPPLAKRLVKG
jgi:hypothetical protein